MRKLVKITCALWLSLTTILAGVMVLRAQPVDWSTDFGELNYCGEQLCFAGIVVGQTRIEEAKAILAPYRAKTKFDTEIATPTIDALIGNMQISVVQFQNKGAIVNVGLSYQPALTLDKFILRFGKPCTLRVDPISSLTTGSKSILVRMYYPSMIANVTLTSGIDANIIRLDFDRPVYLTLTKTILNCNKRISNWKGFTTLNRYSFIID
jgi:hypothetical protein